MRGTSSSRFIASPPQLAEDRPDEPNPPRELDPDEPHELEERLEDDDRVEEDEPELRPQLQPGPEERWT